MVNSGNDLSGDIYLARREFLGNVYAQVTGTGNANATTPMQSQFNVNTYNINAGLPGSFPWLSQVAKNFTYYEFHGLVFEYKPTSGEFGNMSTNALGKVVMCTQYDPDAPNFQSSVQMENYDYATACKPSEHMLHGVETKHTQRPTNMLYVRTGATSKDEALTDLGDFQIATEGVAMNLAASATLQTVTVPIGELWVAYKVKLSRANIYNTINNAPADAFIATALGQQVIGSGQTGSTGTYLALPTVMKRLYTNPQSVNAWCPKNTNTLGVQVWGSSATVYYVVFPPGASGSYAINIGWQSDAAVASQYIPLLTVGGASDLTALITAGYQVPQGLIGIATAAPSTTVTVAGAASSIIVGTDGTITGGGSGIVSAFQTQTATGTTPIQCCGFNYVTFTSTPSQVVILKGVVVTNAAGAHSIAMTCQVMPTLLNGQS